MYLKNKHSGKIEKIEPCDDKRIKEFPICFKAGKTLYCYGSIKSLTDDWEDVERG